MQTQEESQSFNEQETSEIRVLINNEVVGAIIGKGGANVQRVREETGVFLSILKTESRSVTERIMVVKGSTESVPLAIQSIATTIQDLNSESKDCALGVLVHKTAVGALIGKGGSTIKDIQQSTGVRMQISNEPLPGSTEKNVTITGSAKTIYTAVVRILALLKENPLRPGTKSMPYVPGAPVYQQPPYGYPPMGHGAPFQQPPYQQQQQMPSLGMQGPPYGMPPPGPQTNTQKIAIPTVCAGCVIGKGGSVIRDLRMQSGSNISIADAEQSNPTERVVTITGTQQGINSAIYLIRQLVEQYQPSSQY